MLSHLQRLYLSSAAALFFTAGTADAEPRVLEAVLAGTGCKAGKAMTQLSDDRLTIEMPAFEAVAGGPEGRMLTRTHCAAVITFSAEPGKKHVGHSFTFVADADMAEGASGEVTVKLHKQGDAKTSSGVVAYGGGAKRKAQEESVKLQPIAGECGKATTISVSVAALTKGSKAGKSRVALIKVGTLGVRLEPCS